MKALTYKQYRAINMIIISVIFTIVETLIAFGANIWFPELPYTLSLAVIFISLELMRWGGYGVVAALLSGVTFCLASGATPNQFLIYCAGNLATLFALIYLKVLGSDKVRRDNVLTAIYVILVFVLAQLGRWIVSMLLGYSPKMLIQFITTDALSCLFGVVVILVLRNTDGMFENQKAYLLRLEEERRAKETAE